MSSIAAAALWIAIYLALVLAPLAVLLIGPLPPAGGFAWDLSLAVGFAGMAMLGVQFALTARFRRASAPFGIDILYYFHRYMAVIAVTLVGAHYLLLRAIYPQALGTADPLSAPWPMTAGRAALLCFVLVIVTSLWRKPLRIPYDAWRVAHVLLTAAGLILATMHIEGIGRYHDAPGKRWLWLTFVSFWLGLVVYVRLIKPWSMRRRPYRVLDVRPETENSWTLAVAANGHAGMRFQPGQFAWLTLRASPYLLHEHPFSISSSAEHPERIEFTIKARGDFTRSVPAIAPGEAAWLDGPYGAFSVDRYSPPGWVFIAGGVGIAPIMSMLRTLADRGDPRPVLLVDANNRASDIIFRDAIAQLSGRLQLRTVHVLDTPDADWPGECGRVTRELLDRHLPADRRELEYFLCGPKPMTQGVERALRALRIPAARVHSELFDLV